MHMNYILKAIARVNLYEQTRILLWDTVSNNTLKLSVIDKGSNRSRGATRDIGRSPFWEFTADYMYQLTNTNMQWSITWLFDRLFDCFIDCLIDCSDWLQEEGNKWLIEWTNEQTNEWTNERKSSEKFERIYNSL